MPGSGSQTSIHCQLRKFAGYYSIVTFALQIANAYLKIYSMIKACIFDLDGVIVDTAKYHFIAWRRLANEFGFDFTEKENEQLKGVSRMESLDLILKMGGVEPDASEKATLASRKNEWYLELVENMTPAEILPGVETFLKDLRSNGIKIGLGSASKNSMTILKQIRLESCFDVIVDGTTTSRSKPDPEVFQLGAEFLEVKPEECIVFEDAEKGVEAALAGGFWAVGIGDPSVLHKAHLVIPGFEGVNFRWFLNRLKK